MNGFLLGLSSGTVCLTACAPVVLPYLVGEGRSIRRTALSLLPFLAGRLIGYLAFALIAWVLGMALLAVDAAAPAAANPRLLPWLSALRILLGALMVLYAWRGLRTPCAGERLGQILRWFGPRTRGSLSLLYPAVLGLLTGLNLCPPFVAAMVEASRAGTLVGSLLFFAAFFLGTSLFLVPLPVLGALNRYPAARTVARLTAGVVGFLYALSGVTVLAA